MLRWVARSMLKLKAGRDMTAQYQSQADVQVKVQKVLGIILKAASHGHCSHFLGGVCSERVNRGRPPRSYTTILR